MNRKTILVLGLPLIAALHACNDGDDHGTLSVNPEAFTFATAPPEAYARVDRMGGPVTATLLITPAHKDLFNSTNPADDGQYAEEEINTLKDLHYQLDPQLAAFGLASCARTCDKFETCDVTQCLQQVLNDNHLLIPDLLVLDLSKPEPDVYPNGRAFADSVVDRLVALALLDIKTPGKCGSVNCTAETLFNLPLNPPVNDKPLPLDFPYVAAPFPPPT